MAIFIPLSCNGHLYLYLYLIYLAMSIFISIFILFLLQLSSLSLSYFIFGCRPSPCPFNCLGVCNGPQRHRPRKVLLSLPLFTENIFNHPLGKFWREKLVSNICLISRYCLFGFNCHQLHRLGELLLFFFFAGISLQMLSFYSHRNCKTSKAPF